MKQRRRPQATAEPHPTRHPLTPGLVGRVLFWSAAALAAVYLVALRSQAARGIFASDECFHATMSEWLLVHHRLPSTLPEFYSGMFVFYPPLLHITGALWAALFGLRALHFLPVVITGLTLTVVLIGLARSVPAAARSQAALLCMLNDSLMRYGVKLYVECLIPLLFAAAVALLLELRRTARMRVAVALGLVVGLAPLTKLNGWLLVGAIAMIAVAYAVRREGRMTRGLLVALVVGVGLVVPWLVRNQLLFGSALYPAFAPDVDQALYVLYRQKFSTPWLAFVRAVPAAIGPWGSGMAVLALARAAFTRRWTLREGLLILAVLGAFGTAFIPMAQARHLNYFIPVLAVTAAWSIAEAFERRPWLQLGVGVVLVAAVIMRLSHLPDYRAGADLPEHLRKAFDGIGPRMRAGATILSPWPYDTFYYTRRNATWPNPWGQRVPVVDLFHESDPDRFAATLDRCGIDYILVPNLVRMEPFNGSNYPASFVTCVRAMTQRGKLRVVWESPQMGLAEITGRGPAPQP